MRSYHLCLVGEILADEKERGKELGDDGEREENGIWGRMIKQGHDGGCLKHWENIEMSGRCVQVMIVHFPTPSTGVREWGEAMRQGSMKRFGSDWKDIYLK